MQESKHIWFNGKMIPWEQSKSHFLSHALHYGSGVFEGIRCYDTEKGPAVFRLEDHANRLFNSAKIFGMTIPFSKKEISNAIIEVIAENQLKECYIRPLAYYGYGSLGFDMTNLKVDVGVAAWSWGALLGKESITKGIKIKISPYLRPSSNCMPVTAKVSGNYANSVMAKMDALNTGFDDVVMLDDKGFVAECSAENFFMVKKNTLVTPTIENCLQGITRHSVMEITNSLGYTVEEKQITPKEIFEADECFATGTAAEIVPITSINNKQIGNGTRGEITAKLQEEYSKAIHGSHKFSEKWLTYVK